MNRQLVQGALRPFRMVGRTADWVGGLVAEPEPARELHARFALFGFAPEPLHMRVVPRSALVRRVRALTTLVCAGVLTPFAFLVPPHVESFLVAVAFTIYLVHREWNAEYVVLEGTGRCPACAGAIVLESETTLRLPTTFVCNACAQHLTIEAGAAAAAGSRAARAAAPVKHFADDAAIAAVWRRNQAAAYSAWSPGSSSWRD